LSLNERQYKRYQQSLKHHKTREERKELKEKARERKANQKRRRSSPADEEDAGFERMVSRRAHKRSATEVRTALERAFAGSPSQAERTGQVASVHRDRAVVLCDGEELVLELAARGGVGASDLAVGDRVGLAQRSDGRLHVVARFERSSELARPDPGDARRRLVIAANVERALIVMSAFGRGFKPGLIDRFLIALSRGGVEPMLCLNKADLVPQAEERDRLRAALAPYVEPGLTPRFTSTATGEGIEEVRAAIGTSTIVLVGQSGVGKSSLVNALDPEAQYAVAEVRAGDGKGRHTTTASTLRPLASGATLIDTPGIRSLGLWRLERAELAHEFPEFEPHVAGCRYRDCLHDHEPQCAVREAVEGGALEAARYASYLRILASLDACRAGRGRGGAAVAPPPA